MMKTLNKLGMEETDPNIAKVRCNKHQAYRKGKSQERERNKGHPNWRGGSQIDTVYR
jgi:hypothetical protein